MEGILVPIFVCVVLPVSVVLIISLAKMNADNKRTQIIIKAIEANKDVDTDKLIESLKKPWMSARDILFKRLLLGCIFSLIGLVVVIIGIANIALFPDFDTDFLTSTFILGGISIAVGVGYLIVYFVTRKQIDDTAEKK